VGAFLALKASLVILTEVLVIPRGYSIGLLDEYDPLV
jgi:hypothetical protein